MSEHVVIAGGGVGALEGLLALQSLAPDSPQISVLVPGRHFTYRALSVLEPFGGDPAPRYEWPEIARDRGVRWIPDAVAGLRPDAREIDTRDGCPVRYLAPYLERLGAPPVTGLSR
jgi:NADH dehydrogenase FAD-containing subunit